MKPVLLVILSASYLAAAVPPLMPMPATVTPGSGRLSIDGAFSTAAVCPDVRVGPALQRLAARVSRETGIPIPLSGPAIPGRPPTLRVDCSTSAEQPALGEDESYTLEVSAAGALLKASTGTGVLRGLETFSQLISSGPDGFEIAAVRIDDRPRFPWRGLLIDVARHWMPVEVIERNLEAMAAVKLNVLHWHLTDDQGFRVESKRYPRLHEQGSDGHFYTQDEVRRVVAYARERGIRVLPEFDIPGHIGSWLAGYPELASAPGTFQIVRTWGIFDPVLDPTREAVYEFLDGFIGEMAPLFPDRYFHIGGDEVNGKQWQGSAAIQEFVRARKLDGPHGLQAYFNQRLLKILGKYGKTMVGWDEILHPDLPAESVIQSWRGAKSLVEAASTGHRAILSSGYYLDQFDSAATHYAVDPLGGAAAQLTPEQARLILGGEACMWAEYVTGETVDSRIWPRVAAIAERFWSPANLTDAASMYERMEAIGQRLEWTGVRHRAVYGPMLDRIAGGRSVPALRVLADATEATGIRVRARANKYTSLTPMNRLVDAVPPESQSVRALEQAARRVVRNFAASRDDAAALRERFSLWAANDARFQAVAEGNALAAELKPVSRDLTALGVMGLRTLDYMGGTGPAPAAWIDEQKRELTRMRRPSAEVVLAGVRPVSVLLDGLSAKK